VRPGAVLAGCVLGSLLLGQVWAQSAPGGAGANRRRPAPSSQGGRALVAAGEVPDLFLLYTGDVIGYLDPCG
jgi:hypothetical protein